jgi:hypothetical protein
MITATPFLAAAADAKLEDWGPLDEALPGGEPMRTSGTTLWTGDRDLADPRDYPEAVRAVLGRGSGVPG